VRVLFWFEPVEAPRRTTSGQGGAEQQWEKAAHRGLQNAARVQRSVNMWNLEEEGRELGERSPAAVRQVNARRGANLRRAVFACNGPRARQRG
jgi:hypothetical protein